MSSAEFTEWIAYAAIEPFGPDVDDYRAGIGAASNINIHRAEGANPVSPFELMPWREPPPEIEPTPEEITARILGTLDVATNRKALK